MKETGIMMSGDHPVKILDGTKTMTRRTNGLGYINQHPDDWLLSRHNSDNTWVFLRNDTGEPRWIKCPYGQVGDRLWVRETWLGNYSAGIYYKADKLSANEFTKWKPSIFMPRWASRIERIITLLRVERLRDISPADAIAEGGYTVDEFIEILLRLNHLPEDANPWNWVIGW